MNTLEGHTRYVSLMSSHNIIIVCSRSNNGTVCIGIQMPRLSTKLLKGLNIMYGMCGSTQLAQGCYRMILMKIIVCGIVKPTNEFTRLVVNGSSSCGNLTWITARNKLWVRHITNTCDEQDVGFSIDGNLTPNIHFYSDCSS